MKSCLLVTCSFLLLASHLYANNLFWGNYFINNITFVNSVVCTAIYMIYLNKRNIKDAFLLLSILVKIGLTHCSCSDCESVNIMPD